MTRLSDRAQLGWLMASDLRCGFGETRIELRKDALRFGEDRSKIRDGHGGLGNVRFVWPLAINDSAFDPVENGTRNQQVAHATLPLAPKAKVQGNTLDRVAQANSQHGLAVNHSDNRGLAA